MAFSLERRLYLPYGSAQLFDLVADVERYPEFVPGWREVRVIRGGPGCLVVEQRVSIGPVQWHFVTEARLDRPRAIWIHAVHAPFGELDIRWTFERLEKAGCAVGFLARYELGSGILGRAAAVAFERRLLGVVRAFERRARALYA